MQIKRRAFLQTGSLATATLMIPRFLKGFEQYRQVPKGNKVLVVLQLSGGNDGLNTIIPHRNDIYYRSRPKLGITREKALRLTDEAGLHPALTAFKECYDDGTMAVLNGVGYPNPDRSHFRSMDIWHTASASNEYLTNGWIGRYLDAQCNGCAKPTKALEVDDVLSLAMKGERTKGLALKDPAKLYNVSKDPFFKDVSATHTKGEETADYLYKTMAETLSSAQYIYEQARLKPTHLTYPSTQLGRSFKTIASLIFSDIDTKVYYLSLGSFDTHISQQFQQQRLFAEMNDAVKAFVKDLKENDRFDDVLLFTFSEFGRRVGQNASGGTDHGTANNMIFLSGGLKEKGLLNAMPDLSNLDNGDLRHTIDFKQAYATMLDRWLGVKPADILGSQYQPLNFI